MKMKNEDEDEDEMRDEVRWMSCEKRLKSETRRVDEDEIDEIE